jgi:hypothetical protein
MITKLHYVVPKNLLQDAFLNLPSIDFKMAINQPTNRFFYDPWILKPEFKGTAWANLLNTLPFSIGEARIIILKPATCYHSHADIDDRYHLNIQSHYSFLVNIDDQVMYKIQKDGCWYYFDTSSRHSAVNFGVTDRIQLVVRKLLSDNKLKKPIRIKLASTGLTEDDARFLFDDIISAWLNKANKQKIISNFNHDNSAVIFDIEKDMISDLEIILPENFKITKL